MSLRVLLAVVVAFLACCHPGHGQDHSPHLQHLEDYYFKNGQTLYGQEARAARLEDQRRVLALIHSSPGGSAARPPQRRSMQLQEEPQAFALQSHRSSRTRTSVQQQQPRGREYEQPESEQPPQGNEKGYPQPQPLRSNEKGYPQPPPPPPPPPRPEPIRRLAHPPSNEKGYPQPPPPEPLRSNEKGYPQPEPLRSNEKGYPQPPPPPPPRPRPEPLRSNEKGYPQPPPPPPPPRPRPEPLVARNEKGYPQPQPLRSNEKGYPQPPPPTRPTRPPRPEPLIRNEKGYPLAPRPAPLVRNDKGYPQPPPPPPPRPRPQPLQAAGEKGYPQQQQQQVRPRQPPRPEYSQYARDQDMENSMMGDSPTIHDHNSEEEELEIIPIRSTSSATYEEPSWIQSGSVMPSQGYWPGSGGRGGGRLVLYQYFQNRPRSSAGSRYNQDDDEID